MGCCYIHARTSPTDDHGLTWSAGAAAPEQCRPQGHLNGGNGKGAGNLNMLVLDLPGFLVKGNSDRVTSETFSLSLMRVD